MRRSKVVIGIFVALVLIVLTIVLLACTVFVVRDISVESKLSSRLIDEGNIIESSDISKGESIISINKEKIKANIEKSNPYVEVTNITREFPSKVIIEVTIRTGIMLVRSEDEVSAAVIDSEMKVLNVVSLVDQADLGVTTVKGLTFKIPEGGVLAAVGATAEFTNASCGLMLRDIATAAADPSLDLSGTSFLTFFKEISFAAGEGIKAYIKTNKGVTLVLDSTLKSTVFEQLYKCMAVFAWDKQADLTRGYITLNSDQGEIAFKWVESLD